MPPLGVCCKGEITWSRTGVDVIGSIDGAERSRFSSRQEPEADRPDPKLVRR